MPLDIVSEKLLFDLGEEERPGRRRVARLRDIHDGREDGIQKRIGAPKHLAELDEEGHHGVFFG